MFTAFLHEPYGRFFAALRAGGIPSSFFVCGDATKNIGPMCLTRPDCIAIDENVDILEAKKVTDAHGIAISGKPPTDHHHAPGLATGQSESGLGTHGRHGDMPFHPGSGSAMCPSTPLRKIRFLVERSRIS